MMPDVMINKNMFEKISFWGPRHGGQHARHKFGQSMYPFEIKLMCVFIIKKQSFAVYSLN